MNRPSKRLFALALLVVAVAALSLIGGSRAGIFGPSTNPTHSGSVATPTPARSSTTTPGARSSSATSAIGTLAAGTYSSDKFKYRTTYTVPDGWEYTDDSPTSFALRPSAASKDSGIFVWTGMAVASQADGCPEVNEPGRGRSAADFVGFISTNPALEISKPQTVSVGGLKGTLVDLAVAPSWKRACPFSDGQAYAPLTRDNPGPGVYWGIGGKERMRMIILDAGGDNVVGMYVDSTDGATFDALVAQSMPVIESFMFAP